MRKIKPSNRHKMDLDVPELNLNSMMDLFAVLIPALLMMSAVVEMTVLNVSTPSISSDGPPPPTPDKPPLNLTVTILANGYNVNAQGGVLTANGAAAPGSANAQQAPSIPLVQKAVSCGRFRHTWPPPRALNRSEPACDKPEDKRRFWVYDIGALTRKVIELKDAFPDERRLTINANPNVEYESVIDVMDATRDVREANMEMPKPLFDEVLLSPGT